MNNILRGFADELVKLAAMPQQEQDSGVFDGSSTIGEVMNQTQGAEAKSGLKGMPVTSAPGPKKLAPTPLTTPNNMVDVASKSG